MGEYPEWMLPRAVWGACNQKVYWKSGCAMRGPFEVPGMAPGMVFPLE